MATQQDVIKKFVEALGANAVGIDLLDAAVKASSENRFSSWEDLRSSYIAAVKAYSGTTEVEQNSFLKKYCGIDLDDKDTGSITGSSAGGLLVKTAESIVENNDSGCSYPTNAFTLSTTEPCYVIHWPEQSGLTLTQQKIAGRMYHDWIPNSLQLIKESLGIESKQTIEIEFNKGYIGGSIPIYYGTSGCYNFNTYYNHGSSSLNPVIYINTDNYDRMILTDANGIYNQYSNNYMDRMTAHALAHRLVMEKYNKARSIPEEVIEGLVDLVTGIDDLVSKEAFFRLANKDWVDWSVSALTQKEDVGGNIYIDYRNSHDVWEGLEAYVLLRYLAKQTATTNMQRTIPLGTSYDAKKITIIAKNSFTGTIDVRLAATTVTTIDASATTKMVSLRGNTTNNVLRAGNGGSILRGDKGNDHLYGGKGKDIIICADGDGADIIYNYESGKDVITLLSGKVTKNTVSGTDVIFSINKGSIRIKDGVLKNIVLVDAHGKQSIKKFYYNLPSTASYNANKTVITLKAAYSGTIDLAQYAPNVTTVNARAVNKAINIYGNARANVIYAGKSGANIRGKVGNDQLYGGLGKDTFIYANGDGVDTIYNYESGKDILKLLSGKVTKTTVSGADVIFTVNKGLMRVKSGVLKNIILIDAQGKKSIKKLYYNLPSTASYNANKTLITLKAIALGTIDLVNYIPSVTTVNAKAVKKSLNIYGNAKANVFYAGRNGGNIRGRAGADKIYCGAGMDKIWFGKGDGQDKVMNSSKRDIAYFYGIKDIKQITAKKSGGIMKLGLKGTKDSMSIVGWTSSAGLNMIQLNNGVKYRFTANGIFKRI